MSRKEAVSCLVTRKSWGWRGGREEGRGYRREKAGIKGETRGGRGGMGRQGEEVANVMLSGDSV